MSSLSELSQEDLTFLKNRSFDSISEKGKQIIMGINTQLQSSELPTELSAEAPPKEASSFERFAYAYEKADTDIGNLARYVKGKFGLGDFYWDSNEGIKYKSAREAYGPEYANADEETRLQVLQMLEDKELAEKYPELSRQDGLGGIAGFFGTLTGSLMSPTTLIPIGAAGKVTSKGLAVAGGAFGLEYNVLEQLASTGRVDPKEAALATGVSAIATPAIVGSLKILTSPARSALFGRQSVRERSEATKASYEIQEIINNKVADEGALSYEDLASAVTGKLGISKDDLQQILIKSDYKPRIPESKARAMELIKDQASAANPVVGRGLMQGVRDFAGVVSTEVTRINPKIGGMLKRSDAEQGVKFGAYMDKAQPFFNLMSSVTGKVKLDVSRHLANGNLDAASAILSKADSNAPKILGATREILEELKKELQTVGYNIGDVLNYFPRKVKDYKTLLERTGREYREPIERELDKRVKDLGYREVDELPIDEIEDAITVAFRSRAKEINPTNRSLALTRERQYLELTEDIIDLYKAPEEALRDHIESSVRQISKRKFFGKAATNKGVKGIDLENSVTKLISQEVKSGNMSTKDFSKMKELLEARFGMGEQSGAGWHNVSKNLVYQMTIANPMSALTQVADIGMSVFANGMLPTIQSLFGKRSITLSDLGLENLISTEFGSVGTLARFLDRTFKLSGFKAIDKLGKETIVNASYKKFTKMAQSEKGVQQLRKRFGTMLDTEFKNTIDDLRAGNITDNVKMMMFSELTNFQPVSLSEMPLKYLQNPNGRIFYALKSFTIKQLDVMRREIVQEFAKGNNLQAGKKLLGYMTIIPLSGASVQEVKDFISRGNEITIDDIPDQYVSNIIKTLGSSRYMVERHISQGRIMPAIGEMVLPPVSLFDAFTQDFAKMLTDDDGLDPKDSRALSRVPVAGKLVQDILLGAREERRIDDILKDN